MLNSNLLRLFLICNIFLFISASAGYQSNPRIRFSTPAEVIASSEFLAQKKYGVVNRKAIAYMDRYIEINGIKLRQIKKNHPSTFRMINRVFKRYNLPQELRYLAVVESEMNPGALSKVGAAGTWQLMPETARILGLTVNEQTDERHNTARSTKAAALYLRDLHTEFNDWLLVLAAYNCGPGPVYTAIRKSGSRDFWKLQKFLPAESRGHVKKYIAVHYHYEGKGGLTTQTAEDLLVSQ